MPGEPLQPMDRRRLRAIALASALLLFGTSLGAQQQSGDPFAGHTYQPGIDVLDYEITLELPDTGATIPVPPGLTPDCITVQPSEASSAWTVMSESVLL